MSNPQTPNFESESKHSAKLTVRVWDLPTRVFHWTLLVLFAIAWVSAEADGAFFNIHLISGIGVLAMVVFRLIWGIIGSRHALFMDFVKGWAAVRNYGKNMLTLNPPYHVGHNPIGGWMIIALLMTLALTAIAGLFVSDDGFVGPLSGAVSPAVSHAMEDFHEGAAEFLGFLVVVHVAGVAVHGLVTGENLPRAMWNGNKTVPADVDASSIAAVGWWRVALALGISTAIAWSLY